MTVEQITPLIREFGFPVFVVMWFMFRTEKRIDRLIELLTALIRAMEIIAKSVDDHRADTRRANTSRPDEIEGESRS